MEYGTPIESYPNPGVVTPPEPTNAQPTEGAADKKDSSTLNTPASNGAETILTVRLPAESKFYVNDRATLSSGEEREFIARRLVFGKTYTFEVKAVLEKDGKTEERTEIVSIRGGDNREIAFDFSKPESLITSVEIQVPENAKVVLAGVPTKRMGLVRTFQTTELEKGQAWEDYTVVATIEKDGKTIEQTKTLTVVAGEAHKVEFDFDDNTTRFAVK